MDRIIINNNVIKLCLGLCCFVCSDSYCSSCKYRSNRARIQQPQSWLFSILNADPSRQWEGLSCRGLRDISSLSISSFQLKQQQTGCWFPGSFKQWVLSFGSSLTSCFSSLGAGARLGQVRNWAGFPPPCLPSPCATALTCCVWEWMTAHIMQTGR